MFQIGVVGVVGLGFCAAGWSAGVAAFIGGAVIVIGNALFAWRLFADGVAPTRRIVRSVYSAEVLKWCWLAVALYLAVAVLKIAALPFVVGLIAAQVAFWISLAVVR